MPHTSFSDKVHTCESIKSGTWKNLFDGSSFLSLNEFLDAVSMRYFLDQEIADWIELSASTFIYNGGNTKMAKLEGNMNIHKQK